jgi:HK97 family phage major capsid protein
MTTFSHPAALSETALLSEIKRLAEVDTITRAEDEYLDKLIAEADYRRDKNPSIEKQRAHALERIENDPRVELVPAVAPNPFQHMRRVDPDGVAGDAGEARDIALASVDRLAASRSDATPREGLRPLFERSPLYAQHFAATASPDYARAIGKLIATGDTGTAMLAMTDTERMAMARVADFEHRAASLVGTAGGFAVPQLLDASIMITNRGTVNPMRQVARIVTGVSDKWEGVSSDGVTANWYAEAAEVTDDAPTLSQPTITAHKAAAFIPASFEILDDYQTMITEMGRLFADAKDRLEGEAFTVGDGSGKPRGLISRLESHTSTTNVAKVTTTTAGAFDAAQVRNLFAALPPRYRANSAWLSSISVANYVRGLGSDELQSQTVNLTTDYQFQLLGRPYFEASDMAEMVTGTTAATLLVVGDFQNYIIFDRLGSARIELVPHLFGSNRRPNGQRGLLLWWRVGGDVASASNTIETGFRALVNKTS